MLFLASTSSDSGQIQLKCQKGWKSIPQSSAAIQIAPVAIIGAIDGQRKISSGSSRAGHATGRRSRGPADCGCLQQDGASAAGEGQRGRPERHLREQAVGHVLGESSGTTSPPHGSVTVILAPGWRCGPRTVEKARAPPLAKRARKHVDDVAQYLARHRITAAPRVLAHRGGSEAKALIETAQQEGADLLVTGAYGHTRLGEWIFGGVTHDLLDFSPICCLTAH